MQQTTIIVEFKVKHSPATEAHLQQLVLAWAKSKGAEIEGNKIKI